MTDQTVEPVTQQRETVTKQKNPLRIEQGKKLVEYNHRKKEELKHLKNRSQNKMIKQSTNLGLIQVLMYMPVVSVCLD